MCTMESLRAAFWKAVWRDIDLYTALLGTLQMASNLMRCSVTLHSLTAEVHQFLLLYSYIQQVSKSGGHLLLHCKTAKERECMLVGIVA